MEKHLFVGHMSCGILVPQPEIEPVPPALEEQRSSKKHYFLMKTCIWQT